MRPVVWVIVFLRSNRGDSLALLDNITICDRVIREYERII